VPPIESIPSDSIDHLIAQQLPDWLTCADAQHREAYREALSEQQQAADSLKHLLASIPDIEQFAVPLLEGALLAEGLGEVDPRSTYVVISEAFQLPSAAEKLYQPSITHTTRQSLLAAALHNFEAHETQPWWQRKAYLVDEKGRRLAMTFERFASLCRTLDIGGRYQALLNRILKPRAGRGQPADQARIKVEQQFQRGIRSRMRAALHEGRLKGQLDEQDLLRLLSVLATPAQPVHGKGSLIPRQLYVLGKCMVGIIALEWRPLPDSALDEIIVWIPDDPYRSVRFYDSWGELYDDLARRLEHRSFQTFLRRFVKAQDRSEFDQALSRALAASKKEHTPEIDGRNLAVSGDVFAHVQALLITRIFDDASYLAVATDQEDRLSRHRRLQAMLSAGLDLLGLVAFVVPVVGDLMLVLSAAQLLDEVYEGYQDWQLGDRQGALDHLFTVAQGLVFAGASAGAIKAIRRVPFVDGLAPRPLPGGKVKLARSLHYFPAEENASVLLQGLQGNHLGELQESNTSMLQDVTGFSTEQLRQLCQEHASPPARLLDIHERIALHTDHPGLRGVAFEEQLLARRQAVSDEQRTLMNAFRYLSPRGAQEIIEHSSSSQLEKLQATGRVPLGMAERARWHERDSRIDRACLGMRLAALGTADSEKLAMGLIERQAPWPAALRVELREGHQKGRLLYASPDTQNSQVSIIVRQPDGYRLANDANHLASGTLLETVLRTFDEQQKTKLGNRNLQARQLRQQLLVAAVQDRQRTAEILGLPRIGANLRPPRRFADGRLGYPLSGGGESSRQAIRQGIHQIFPTLSELQLDAYLNAVRQRGENLWSHYQMLQRQLGELRETLRAWQADWQSPVDAIRRRRIVDALRRSWRRKLVDGNDQYELFIDGESVPTLPALPAGIEYGHVRRLTLRDMHLEHIDAQFLRRFPNIVDLDLSGNRLTQVPEGIESLTQLRRVNLGNNRITLDQTASNRLAQLQRLDTLILSYNPLNGLPDLSALPHVRDLQLRATGHADISQIHQLITMRAHVDLRDNRISELQREMRGLRLRLQRLNLHDNPLSESSIEYLDEARGVTDAGGRGSASYTHGVIDEDTRANWVASRNELLRAQREAAWDRLIEEPGSAGMFRFLADFAQSEDFQDNPRHYRRRAWHILEACENNEALREQLFREADGPRSCDDRLLLMLNQMEVGVMAYQGVEGVPAAMRETSLLHLGEQLHRLDLLDAIANRHVQRLRQAGRKPDEIEVRLFYRLRLADALDLPVPPDEMHFASYAHVTSADLNDAQLEVLGTYETLPMLDALAARPYWQTYLRETYAERFEAMAGPYHDRMEALEAQATAGQEGDYEERARSLMHELAAEESTLIRRLTAEAWARARLADVDRPLQH